MRTYTWGNDPPDCDHGVFGFVGCPVLRTAPVGSKEKDTSPYGAMDMSGNVSEMVEDQAQDNPYVTTPADGQAMWFNRFPDIARGVRGGNWKSSLNWRDLWVANRGGGVFLDQGRSEVGLRCAFGDRSDADAPDVTHPERKGFPPSTQTGNLKGLDETSDAEAVCGPSPTGRGGEMCDVPAGVFVMGCASQSYFCFDYEKPGHDVALSAYKIDKYDVTAADYKVCVESGGCTLPANVNNVCNERCNYAVAGREDHPINCVRWEQAGDYCVWAGKRLPTEAEWEKAARGTDGRLYPWGNDALSYDCEHAVSNACVPQPAGTAPVGSKPKGVSPVGAMDMAGNIRQWVWDYYDEYYYNYSPAADPRGPEEGRYHVVRGDFWWEATANDYTSLRSAIFVDEYWSETLGFRCAY
jgi:formylglycine-generating enzyme required for sulfatase activity